MTRKQNYANVTELISDFFPHQSLRKGEGQSSEEQVQKGFK